MFILQGLQGAWSVSIVYAGVTEAGLANLHAKWGIGIDSIGVANPCVGSCGSAHSKGFIAACRNLRDGNVGYPTPGVSCIVSILNGSGHVLMDRFDLIGVRELRRPGGTEAGK